MKDLSMHIMDIVQNSVRAKASEVNLSIKSGQEWLVIEVKDNGCGMDKETVQRVVDPFFTSRTTRKVGMGIPLFKQNAELTGGDISIKSEPGKGTVVKTRFGADHIDRPPIGDLSSTVAMIISGNPGTEVRFECSNETEEFVLDSREVKEVLGDLDIRLPKVTSFLKEMIEENLKELNIKFD